MSAKTLWDRVMLVSGGRPSAWAASLGINPTTVTHWQGAPRQPYKSTLAGLAKATGIPAEWWLRGEGEVPPDAARRFGLMPTGQPAPVVADGQVLTHGQYLQRHPAQAASLLPTLHRTAASQRHAHFHPMFSLLIQLWATEQVTWLPDDTTLEQAAALVNAAAAQWVKQVSTAPPFHTTDEMVLAVARMSLHNAWLELTGTQPAVTSGVMPDAQ